jgi:hypothetical protein
MSRTRVVRAASRALLVVVLAASIGCTTAERALDPSGEPTTPPTAPPAAHGPPDEAPLPLPPVDPDAPHPLDCDADRRTAMQRPVSTQLDAFAVEDVALAYAMTSPFFQRVLAADDFATLIREQYAELLGNGGHRFAECRVRGRRGHLVVGVRDGVREVVLRYDLSEESEGWRIDGAMRIALTLPPQPLA